VRKRDRVGTRYRECTSLTVRDRSGREGGARTASEVRQRQKRASLERERRRGRQRGREKERVGRLPYGAWPRIERNS
jgi:hypothetical protein